MEKKRFPIFFSIVIVITGFFGCMPSQYTYTVWEPVYMSWSEFRSPSTIEITSNREINNPGKIYVYGDLLFINERNEGIHVIDNSDPSSPRNISFISVIGSIDISVLDIGTTTYLYTDSYVDLLIFEINPDPANFTAQLSNRIEEAFPYDPYQSFIDDDVPPWFSHYDQSDGIIVNYIEQRKSEWYWDSPVQYDVAAETNGTAGTGGSMARFLLYQDVSTSAWFLYVVNATDLIVLDLVDPGSPARQARVDIGWGIETIYEYQDHLFIGSESAMYIYCLLNPKDPNQVSELVHWRSRDPVVAGPVGPEDKDTAFVTLRSENGWGTDQLLAVDVGNVEVPQQLLEISLFNPHGLALFDFQGADRLIIAEGDAGLKVFDVTNVHDDTLTSGERLNQLLTLDNDINTYDIIALGTRMLVIGENGFYQYQYSESTESGGIVPQLTLLSSIQVSE
ncbi:MAG: hypothetical protein ACLFR1_14415 [Spirochaetia bacterium]